MSSLICFSCKASDSFVVLSVSSGKVYVSACFANGPIMGLILVKMKKINHKDRKNLECEIFLKTIDLSFLVVNILEDQKRKKNYGRGIGYYS